MATVLEQIGDTTGDYRTRQLDWIAGEKRTCTIHRESGCSFRVDLAQAYFSPRLSYERSRIAAMVADNVGRETIVNFFSGVGCFSIRIAKSAPRAVIYSVDINPNAIRYMLQNTRRNAVSHQVTPILGDAWMIAGELFKAAADRVLLPLPEKSLLYLSTATETIRQEGGIIHFYDFATGEDRQDSAQIVAARVAALLSTLSRPFAIRRKLPVRSVGPRRYLVAVDIEISAS